MKAIGGRGSFRKNPIPQYNSIGDTPNRQASGRSTTSASMYEGSTFNAIIHSALVLHPEITIIPEVQNMDSGSCSLWVGISITAKLSKADGESTFETIVPGLGMSSFRVQLAMHLVFVIIESSDANENRRQLR